MSSYYSVAPNQGGGPSTAESIPFHSSSYIQPATGYIPDSRGGYGVSSSSAGHGFSAGPAGFGPAAGVSGHIGEGAGLRKGWIAAFSTEGYLGEPSLAEELGINWSHINTKTLAVLNPLTRIDQHIMDDSDLVGPIAYYLLFASILYVRGRLDFGFIYGLAVIGSALVHILFSLMSPDDASGAAADHHHHHPSAPAYGQMPGVDPSQAGYAPNNRLSSTLTLARSTSVLGYCLLPLVLTSPVGVFVAMDTPIGAVLTCAAMMWCTYSATRIFCEVGRMREMTGLVAYPLMLFYVGFGIMSVFSGHA